MGMWKALKHGFVVFLEVLIGRRCTVCFQDNLSPIIGEEVSSGKRFYRECRDCGAKMDVPPSFQ